MLNSEQYWVSASVLKALYGGIKLGVEFREAGLRRNEKDGTYLNMHRRFPSDMQGNLGKSLHVFEGRRFVRSEGMCSGIYHQFLSSLTHIRPRVTSREWWREGRTYNA